MPGQSGGPVVTTLVCFTIHSHARLRVHWHPAFPTPSIFQGGRFMHHSGASRREIAKPYLKLVSRHCEEQSDEAIHSFFVRQDGLLRSARNDGLSWLFEN
jgi:hypothetical protein